MSKADPAYSTISVSMVSSAIDTQTRDFDATEILKVIRSGERNIRAQVEAIRKTFRSELATHRDYKRAKKAIDPAKKQLPAVTWSGTFTERTSEKLVNHSGLLCADLDNLGPRLKDVREKLSYSPHAWAMFLSPSGDGLKAVLRVPADGSKHRGSFRAVQRHIRELVGVEIDESCKDVARLCFLSYDPQVFHNPNAIEIEPLAEPEKPRSVNGTSVDLSARQRIAGELLGSIDWQSETSGVITCPGKHLHTTGDGDRDCKIDLDQVPTVHCFHNSCRGILDGVNRELRSRIGKVEHTDSENRKGERANRIQSANAENTPGDQSEDPIDAVLKASGLAALEAGASMTAVELAVRGLASLLADADEIRRATVREAALKKLDEIAISAPARLLDAALGTTQAKDENKTGQALVLTDPDPWPSPVNLAELLDDITNLIRRYIVFPLEMAHAVALWILHTWALESFDISPLLTITSPTKRCGKTNLLEIVGMLTPRPISASNITAASVFRTIEKFRPVLLIDEADTFAKDNDQLRGVINGGHHRSSAFVVRTIGEDHDPRLFSTWCGKAIAAIQKLADTLEDRSISISMRRRAKHEQVEKLRTAACSSSAAPLRQKAFRWASDNIPMLRRSEPQIPNELNDRAADNWHPLLAIADLAGGKWPRVARNAAITLSGEIDDDSSAIELLKDLQVIFHGDPEDETDDGCESIASAELVRELNEKKDRPWADWNKGKGISQGQVARILRSFDIRPKTIRVGDKTPKGYLAEWFKEPFERYLPSNSTFKPQHPQQTNKINGLDHKTDPQQKANVADRKSDLSTREINDVADVADRKQGSGWRYDL